MVSKKLIQPLSVVFIPLARQTSWQAHFSVRVHHSADRPVAKYERRRRCLSTYERRDRQSHQAAKESATIHIAPSCLILPNGRQHSRDPRVEERVPCVVRVYSVAIVVGGICV